MQTLKPQKENGWHLGKGPFLFYGVPPILNGKVELVNTSDENIKVKKIPIAMGKTNKLIGHNHEQVRLMGRLPSKCCLEFPAHFSIDLTTSPGKYTIELISGEKKEKAIVHVFEKLNINVFPNQIRLIGGGGETLSTELVIKNEGNVNQTLKKRSLLYLEEKSWIGRTSVYALRKHKDTQDYTAYLNGFLKEFHKTSIPPARATIDEKTVGIKPGETKVVRLNIILPTQLRKGKTYISAIDVMNTTTDLPVEIFCNKFVKSHKGRPR